MWYESVMEVINRSRYFKTQVIDGVKYRKCGMCDWLKPQEEEYFRYYKGEWRFRTVCRRCENLGKKNQRIIDYNTRLINKRLGI